MPNHDASPDLRTAYPALYRPSKGYVFVVTYGRSGSTLTQNLLNSIPGWCIRGENANVLGNLLKAVHMIRRHPMYAKLTAWRAMGSPHTLAGFGTPIDPWFGAELVDCDAFARDLLNTFASRVLNLAEGLRVGGFKEICYFGDPDFLAAQLALMQEYFPSAKILFQTRDHGQVITSSWWKNRDPVEVKTRLTLVDGIFRDYAQIHSDCFVLDYSSYMAGPQALRPLFDFLAEDFNLPMVEGVLNTRLDHRVKD